MLTPWLIVFRLNGGGELTADGGVDCPPPVVVAVVPVPDVVVVAPGDEPYVTPINEAALRLEQEADRRG